MHVGYIQVVILCCAYSTSVILGPTGVCTPAVAGDMLVKPFVALSFRVVMRDGQVPVENLCCDVFGEDVRVVVACSDLHQSADDAFLHKSLNEEVPQLDVFGFL